MAITVNSPGWKVQSTGRTRGATRAQAAALDSLPPVFLAADARIAEEAVLERSAVTSRGGERERSNDQLDVSFDLTPDRAAYLAVRHPSGALTFHMPVQESTARGGGKRVVRFQLVARERATRGLGSKIVKAILVEVRRVAVDKIVSFAMPKLAALLERTIWDRAGRKEGWLSITKDTLATGALASGTPISPKRSLLFLHGTFSHAAAAYKDLAASHFFERAAEVYGDRIFAFDHFSVSRTPEENARMLLQGLPDQATTFDVIAHSRGGLVLRNLVERRKALGALAERFQLNRAVMVASPNAGTPLATPQRWEDTFGWFANIIEFFPENPFTTGAEFIANGLVWVANHASGDLPGLHAMDGDGDLIVDLQGPPGPDPAAYSALVSNFQPTGNLLVRLADLGMDQFFASANDLVVPTEGGWRVDDLASGLIPASRIGCFGDGGNLAGTPPTHIDFFDRPATVDFLLNALTDKRHAIPGIDPTKSLPDRKLLRRGGVDSEAPRAVLRAAARAAQEEAEAQPALQITVTHGNLTFEPEALLIGHYASTGLSGAEAVIDTLIGGAMRHSLEIGLYPRDCGSHQIFINRRIDPEHGYQIPRPRAVIVVGLGQEGDLGAADLARTVKQAVIAWSQRLFEKKSPPKIFDVSSTLMGSGGANVTAAEAARLIAQGVAEANDLLATELDKKRWPRVARLKLVELYLDRATDAWRALRIQQDATPDRYALDDVIAPGMGGIQRPPESSYRGVSYDFISVESRSGKDGEEITYSLDTRRARSEVRGKRTQSGLLRNLVLEAANDTSTDTKIGQSLFNLLVPLELEAYLAGTGELQLQLSPTVAGIPWELLENASDSNSDTRPWAIRTKLLRKLKLEGVREQVRDANADESALVIGEPECPKDLYPRLFGAHEEAVAVRDSLCSDVGLGPDRVTALVSDSEEETGPVARDVIGALYERPWRILHIAGHGALPDPVTGSKGGVVLSNNTFLGPDEIESMRVVPELVFINCCHLARGTDRALLNPRFNRAEFASGVAQELIRIGVRAVIAAGWAVDDDAASAFAKAFYGAILKGARLIDAVALARTEAFNASTSSNTWAAYQCYGDPDWRFRKHVSDPNQGSTAPDEFRSVASLLAVELALKRLTVETRFQGSDSATQIARLRALEEVFAHKWTDRKATVNLGAIAERFGESFVEAGDTASGIKWYERAVASEDASASLKAAEQLCNARARRAWELVDGACRYRDEMRARTRATGLSAGAKRAAQHAFADAEKKCRDALKDSQRLLNLATTLLTRLRGIDDTMERASLAGSIQKRRALIGEVMGANGAPASVLSTMQAEYTTAERLGRAHGASDLYYPAFNRIVAEVALKNGRPGWKSPDAAVVKGVKAILKEKNKDGDFWSLVGQIELDQMLAIADGSFPTKANSFRKEFEALYVAVKARRKWGSVYDTATLILNRYRAHLKTAKQKQAVDETLATLRRFAHP